MDWFKELIPMRNFILAAAIAATTLTAIPAVAQNNPNREYRQDVRDARQDYRRDVRDAQRDRNRDWRQYRNYDYNRFEGGQRAYYAENYYRNGQYYQPRRLTRNDRIYRGRDNRYYCRRGDGTTGLIIGGLAGGALGNTIAGGGSRLLGTLIGGGAGALLGQSVDRGNVVCR
jgi:hypothetical protein